MLRGSRRRGALIHGREVMQRLRERAACTFTEHAYATWYTQRRLSSQICDILHRRGTLETGAKRG